MARGSTLEATAATLALAVAGIHLHWGVPRFVAYASVGVLPDPRPLAFVLSGHAILVAVTLVAVGAIDARRTYLPGAALVVVHLLGYVAWHTVLAHGGAGHGHVHLSVVGAPLAGSPLALGAAVAELSVAAVFLARYRDTRR